MSSFGWAGAGAGASDALQELLTRAFREKQAQDSLALQQQAQQLQREQFEANKSDRELQRRTQAAQVRASLLQPGPIGAEDVSALTGTPYEALVERKQTLPSHSIAATGMPMQSDTGGESYAALRPTTAQMREQQQRTDLARLATDTTLPPDVRRYVDMRRAGIAIPNPESLETQAERDARVARDRESAFGDFARRTRLQADIQESTRQRAARDAANAPITARDRREAMRIADNAANEYLDSIKDSLGMLPTGVDPQAIRQQYIDEYLAANEPPTSPANQRRVISNLQKIMRPTRTGRMTAEFLMPRGAPSTPGAVSPSMGSSDPYERYLARTGAR